MNLDPPKTIRISQRYEIIVYDNGKIDTLEDGKPFIWLDRGSLVWDIVQYVLEKEKVHLPENEIT